MGANWHDFCFPARPGSQSGEPSQPASIGSSLWKPRTRPTARWVAGRRCGKNVFFFLPFELLLAVRIPVKSADVLGKCLQIERLLLSGWVIYGEGRGLNFQVHAPRCRGGNFLGPDIMISGCRNSRSQDNRITNEQQITG